MTMVLFLLKYKCNLLKKKGNIIFLARQTFFIFFNQHSARKKGTFCQNLNWKKKKKPSGKFIKSKKVIYNKLKYWNKQCMNISPFDYFKLKGSCETKACSPRVESLSPHWQYQKLSCIFLQETGKAQHQRGIKL